MIIPEFQRRRLASSVVGTAGIDTSGAQAAGAIAQSAGQVANTFQTIAVQRQDAMDKAVAFDKSLTYESETAKLSLEHQKEYATWDGDPVERAEVFREKTKVLRDSMAASMPSDKARAEFLQSSGSTMNSAFKSELSLASKNQVAIGLDRVNTANTKISDSAYTLFKDHPDIPLDAKMGMYRHLERRRSENANNSIALLGPEEALKLNNSSREGLAVASMAGLLESDPTQALKFLKDKDVKDAMGSKVHAEWVDKVQKKASDFKEIVKEQEFEYLSENHSKDLKAVQDGAGLDYILNIKDKKASEILLDQYLDARQLTEEEIALREADLFTQWQDFFVRNKKTGKLTADIKKDKTMKDVVELQYEYMRNAKIMRGKGQLKASVQAYPDMLRQAIKNDKPNPLLDSFVNALNAMSFSAVDAVSGGAVSKDRAKDQAILADNLYSKLVKLDPNNTEHMQQAVRDTLKEYQFYKTPQASKYVVGESYTVAGQVFKAVRRPDGSIGLDDGK